MTPDWIASARSLTGPWSEFKDIAPADTKTYGAQSTMLLKIVGAKTTTVIFMGDISGDIWRPAAQWDSRNLWMPVQIGNAQLRVPTPQPWRLDVRTDEAQPIADSL